MSNRSLDSLLPTETLALDSGLTLSPRIKLSLTIHRYDASVKPIDDWQLKRSLIDFCKSNFSVTIPEEDLEIRKFKDLKKRKREEPVARGTLFIRDLGFLCSSPKFADVLGEDDKVKVLERKYAERRKNIVDKMDGIELSIVGDKFKLSVEVPASDDFDATKREWEELVVFGSRGNSRGGRRQPDTIVLRGVPSRWFAETRVSSSKPSILVSHTIFSAFGKIRNLDVAEDDDIGKLENEDGTDIVPGLHCKIVVRFEEYHDFYNALKVLSGRSLQKQGSRLRADYEVTWDKDGYSRNARSQPEATARWTSVERYKSEAPRRQPYNSHLSAEHERSKRFKERGT